MKECLQCAYGMHQHKSQLTNYQTGSVIARRGEMLTASMLTNSRRPWHQARAVCTHMLGNCRAFVLAARSSCCVVCSLQAAQNARLDYMSTISSHCLTEQYLQPCYAVYSRRSIICSIQRCTSSSSPMQQKKLSGLLLLQSLSQHAVSIFRAREQWSLTCCSRGW